MTIEVNGSPIPEMLWTAVRQAAPPIMAFAIGRGWVADDTAIMLGALGAIAWPVVYGQIKSLERSRKLVTLAEAAPDSVAVVK